MPSPHVAKPAALLRVGAVGGVGPYCARAPLTAHDTGVFVNLRGVRFPRLALAGVTSPAATLSREREFGPWPSAEGGLSPRPR